MTTPRYFEDLAERLRSRGVPAEQVAATVDELSGYLAETGTDPEEEFGPVDAFAEQLTTARTPGDTGTGDPNAPGASDESWSFHADAFNEVELLRRFGEQGWEVVSYDIATGFDCRRSLEHPQRWEYRREIVPPRRRRTAAARLAEDGWETAATFMSWHYFKRPVAATAGPAGELDAAPVPPERRVYVSRTLGAYGAVTWGVCMAALVGIVLFSASGLGGLSGSAVAGAFAGFAILLIVFAVFFAVVTRNRRKADRR
jgi:hypothetical protein